MKNNAEISERISKILEFLGITRNAFARELGYERGQTVYDILNGKSAPSYDFFKRFMLSEYSEQFNLDWIFTGRGEMIVEKSCADNTQVLNKDALQMISELSKQVARLEIENESLKPKSSKRVMYPPHGSHVAEP